MGNKSTKIQTIDVESQEVSINEESQLKITKFFKTKDKEVKQKHSLTKYEIIEELKAIKC